MLYLSKHLVCQRIATGEYFVIEFELDAAGVYAGPASVGCFAFGPNVAQRNVEPTNDALHADLSFKGEWFPVRVPWKAIRRIISARGVWPTAAASLPASRSGASQT